MKDLYIKLFLIQIKEPLTITGFKTTNPDFTNNKLDPVSKIRISYDWKKIITNHWVTKAKSSSILYKVGSYNVEKSAFDTRECHWSMGCTYPSTKLPMYFETVLFFPCFDLTNFFLCVELSLLSRAHWAAAMLDSGIVWPWEAIAIIIIMFGFFRLVVLVRELSIYVTEENTASWN